MADLTEKDIEVCDLEINDDGDGISTYLETFFDVDEKFGTSVKDDENSWVNFYAEYFPKSDALKCIYVIDRTNSSEEHEYIPSPAEKRLIISKMEEVCRKESACTMEELLEEYSHETPSLLFP